MLNKVYFKNFKHILNLKISQKLMAKKWDSKTVEIRKFSGKVDYILF